MGYWSATLPVLQSGSQQVSAPSGALIRNALVLGAGGAMGRALVEKLSRDPQIDQVFAVSRRPFNSVSPKVHSITTEYTETAMQHVVVQLAPHAGTFTRVCICHGILHSESVHPEKRCEDIDPESMQEVLYANALVPALWLKLLLQLLVGTQPAVVACFSARVGSTGDNRLGGWYSYRASKAALNSLLKTYAIEYRRRAKNVKLLAFHPGTVDSQMSKPFQASVPPGKLFTADYVAVCLAELMDNLPCDGELSYLDYAGKPIPW